MICPICPRHCETEPSQKKYGFCGDNTEISLSWAGLHFGEEPVLTVFGGSGAVFVSGCNLRCAFCQNYQISQQFFGKQISIDDFAQICLKLQENGAENINIVTGTHETPRLIEGMRRAREAGVTLPFCWNSSGYESVETIRALSEFVTIWLPDLKTLNPLMADTLFHAKNYPRAAKAAIKEMVALSPLKFVKTQDAATKEKRTKIVSGVIVRHLYLPNRMSDTKDVVKFFSENFADKALLSLMMQYTPVKFSASEFAKRKTALESFQNRLPTQEETQEILKMFDEFCIDDGFIQSPSDDDNWLPDFKKGEPFSDRKAKTIWSCVE